MARNGPCTVLCEETWVWYRFASPSVELSNGLATEGTLKPVTTEHKTKHFPISSLEQGKGKKQSNNLDFFRSNGSTGKKCHPERSFEKPAVVQRPALLMQLLCFPPGKSKLPSRYSGSLSGFMMYHIIVKTSLLLLHREDFAFRCNTPQVSNNFYMLQSY